LWKCPRTIPSRGTHRQRCAPSTQLPAIDRKARGKLVHAFAHLGDVGRIARIVEHVSNQVGSELGLGLAETACRYGRRAKTYSTGNEGLLGIVGNGVLVDRDVRLAQGGFSVFTREPFRTQVN